MEGCDESGLEKVTMGGKSRGEAGEVTGVVANAPITDGLGKKV